MKSVNFFRGAAAAVAIAFAVPASATLILDPNPYPNLGTAGVHTNSAQSNTSVTGYTVPGNFGITFTSPTTLNTNGSGVAVIGTDWQTLTITPTLSSMLFSAIEFNLSASGITGQSSSSIFVDILVTFADNTTKSFLDLEMGNGQNKYLVYGNAGELFKSITFSAYHDKANTLPADLDDVRQVGVALTGPGAVPEPSTWSMMLLGFGVVGVALRRRQSRRVAFA